MLILPMALPITMLLKNSYPDEYVELHKGVYMTIIVALPYLTGIFGAAIWGRFTDHYGRRPIMLLSLTGSFVSMLLCGTATTYAQFVVGRGLSGFIDSSLFLCKAIMGDVTNAANQTKRFSDMMACFAFSLAVSPNIARLLDVGDPAMPALLPCSVGCGLLLIAIILVYVYVPETLHPAKLSACDVTELETVAGDIKMYDDVDNVDFLWNRGSILSTVLYGMIALFLLGSESLVPLITVETPEESGFGESKDEVILFFTVQGIVYVCSQTFVYPTLSKRLGTIRSFRYGCVATGLLIASGFTPTFLHEYGDWTVISMCILIGVRIIFISLALTASIELVNNATKPHNRGKLNAAAHGLASMTRASGCVSTGAVYDLCRRFHCVYVVFCALGAGMLVCAWLSLLLPNSVNRPIAPSDSLDRAVKTLRDSDTLKTPKPLDETHHGAV